MKELQCRHNKSVNTLHLIVIMSFSMYYYRLFRHCYFAPKLQLTINESLKETGLLEEHKPRV